MKTKVCTQCKQVKPLTEFWRNKNTKDGREYSCSICRSLQMKGHRKKNPDIYRKKHLSYKFGLSLEDYEELLKSQDGVCAICKGVNKNGERLFIDHDHNTGKIRGLLCVNCNTAIGVLYDSIDKLHKAIEYLERD